MKVAGKLYLDIPSFFLTFGAKQFIMDIRPLYDRVILKPIKMEEVTKSGIIIPDTVREGIPTLKAIVEAVGPGTKDDPTTVKKGDTVLYQKYAGTRVELEKEEYLIVQEREILAII